MSKLNYILRNPPMKEVRCSRCGGDKIINRRGMITSDPCPRCNKGTSEGSTGKEQEIDYRKFAKQVRKAIKEEKK